MEATSDDEIDAQPSQCVANMSRPTQISPGVEDPNDISKRRILNEYGAYKPIIIEPGKEQIRLMQILPAKNDEDDIVCAVFDVPSDWVGIVYVALSYYWGDLGQQRTIGLIHQYQARGEISEAQQSSEQEKLPGRETMISVNPKTKETFNVTETLFQALRSIRKATPRLKKEFPILDHQPLWVDATCINQGDIDERNSQVGIMSKSYSNAWYVWIWLGESEETMQGLNLISAMIQLASDTWGPDFDILAPKKEHMHHIFHSTYKLEEQLLGPESCFQILERLFQHPYFRRIWVLQEATLRAERTFIHVTDAQVPWAWIIVADRFRGLWRKAVPTGQSGSLPVIWAPLVGGRLTHMKSDPHKGGTCQHTTYGSLYTLFTTTYEQFEATDLRDKLFALLDLATETVGGRKVGTVLAPDYGKTTTQVFRDFTRWCIRRNGSLDVLSMMCDGPRRLLPDNPLYTLKDGKLPPGCLDARFHPSWALWPTPGGYWTVSSLIKAQNHRNAEDFDLASKHKLQIFNLSTHPSWKVPPAIRDCIISLAGRRIGRVKSVYRAPLRCFAGRDNPTFVKYKWATEELKTDVEKHHGTHPTLMTTHPSLMTTHPYRENVKFEGGLAPLWYYIREASTNAMVVDGKEEDEILESKSQEWLGREGGRYEGHAELMFRDFLETLLLSPVYRGNERFSDPDNEDIPQGPWSDPDIAMSLAAFWAENDSRMMHLPPRIGKYLLDNLFKRAIRREQQFPFLFLAHGKCFFITEDERMGLCSPDTEKGDIVVGLFGAGVPFVLRPMDHEADVEGETWSFEGDAHFKEHLFRFMGECYLHERMTSAFFDDEWANLGPPEVFNLC